MGKGSIYNNGASVNNGPTSRRTWKNGFQGERPVTFYDFTEPRPEQVA